MSKLGTDLMWHIASIHSLRRFTQDLGLFDLSSEMRLKMIEILKSLQRVEKRGTWSRHFTSVIIGHGVSQ